MLDLDLNREGPTARDAATLVVARDASGGGIEVFCVERQKAGFLGGAVVFPGGKLDASDLDPEWEKCSTPPRPTRTPIADSDAALRGLAIAACREALEEAAILPIAGAAATHAELLAWRAALARGSETLRLLLAARGLRLDLASLHALARWVTPIAESRRFDTRFFLYVPDGATTERTTTTRRPRASGPPRPTCSTGTRRGALVLAPPTHRTLQVLARRARHGRAPSRSPTRSCLEPICPRVVAQREAGGDTVAIVLPGDPEHDVREARVPGPSRYVLRGGRFWPEAPPAGLP